MATDVAATGLPWIEEVRRSFDLRPFADFHRRELPQLVERHGVLIASDVAGAPTIAFRIDDGTTFSWAPGNPLDIGDDDAGATTLIELSEDTFSDFLHELLTANGAVRTGRARVARGSLEEWQRWEPAMQSLLFGRPIYGPEVWETLVDHDGTRLDLHRSFAADDPEDEMRAFLATTGYLHIRAVFSDKEVARYGAEIEHCRAETIPGDPFSWWSVNASGDEVVTRINYLDRFSPPLLKLAQDPRLARYAGIAGSDLRVCDDRLDGPMVFVKNANVVQGNGDLIWHVDDGIGGHPVMCPLVQCGIQLDPANAANGQLLLLAGSHRYAKHWLAGATRATCRSSHSKPNPATSPCITATRCTRRRHPRRTTRADAPSITSSPSTRPSTSCPRTATTTTPCSASTPQDEWPPAPRPGTTTTVEVAAPGG